MIILIIILIMIIIIIILLLLIIIITIINRTARGLRQLSAELPRRARRRAIPARGLIREIPIRGNPFQGKSMIKGNLLQR